MKFRLNYKVESTGFDYSTNSTYDGGRVDSMIQMLASELSDQDYHELCHQLHGSKSQFDEIDGECSVGSSLQEKKRYTVYSALYRGIYWGTMKALDDLDLEKMEVEEDQD